MGGPDHSISSFWVYEGLRRPSAEEQLLEESSKTDRALMEEASRYGNASNPCGTLVCDFSSPSSFFSGRTPLQVFGVFDKGIGEGHFGVFGKKKKKKKRERVHSKTFLEKSKVERELKRLECSINYEEGRKQKGTMQGRGCQILVVQ